MLSEGCQGSEGGWSEGRAEFGCTYEDDLVMLKNDSLGSYIVPAALLANLDAIVVRYVVVKKRRRALMRFFGALPMPSQKRG